MFGQGRRPRRRFCEQSPPLRLVLVHSPRVARGGREQDALDAGDSATNAPLQFAQTIDQDFSTFWESLDGLRTGTASFRELHTPNGIPIPAYKSLIRMALSIMPEAELSAFTDAIEWVGNPDHHVDKGLFNGVGCLVYQVHAPFQTPWTSLLVGPTRKPPCPTCSFSWPRAAPCCNSICRSVA